jgi:hypothetical protein
MSEWMKGLKTIPFKPSSVKGAMPNDLIEGKNST